MIDYINKDMAAIELGITNKQLDFLEDDMLRVHKEMIDKIQPNRYPLYYINMLRVWLSRDIIRRQVEGIKG